MTKKDVEEIKRHFDERWSEVTRHSDERWSAVERRFDERWAAVEGRFDERTAEFKAHVDSKTDETARLFGVVGESLRAEIRQVAEGVTLANERIDGLAVQMDQMGTELRTEIRLVAGAQAELLTRVETLESKPTAR